jgi:hypothetical protein
VATNNSQMSTRKINAKGFILNVKLKSPSRKGEEVLGDLLLQINKSKIREKISPDREVMFKNAFKDTWNNVEFLHGKFISGVELIPDEWFNVDELEQEEVLLDEKLRANMREAEFVFVPKAHRMYVVKKLKSISHKQIQKYLFIALNKVIQKDEEVEIFIEKDSEKIEEIFKNKRVDWIEFNISRSNNDNTDGAIDFIQEQMDEANVYKYTGKVQSKNNEEGINVETKFIKGVIHLGNSNGYVKARISEKEATSKAETINTLSYEKEFRNEILNSENKFKELCRFVYNKFRNGGQE